MNSENKREPHKNHDWERLHEVIKFSRMSINAFALHIGLPRSENLYQIKKGNHGISKTLAETIHRYYPNYSVGWLLSGEAGTKLPPDAEKIELRNDTLQRVAVYNRLATDTKPVYHIYISEHIVNGATMAVINNDEAVNPRIPVGAMVFVKPAEQIVAGKLYLIVTQENTMIRKIRLSEDNETLRLEAVDRENFDDTHLKKESILKLFSVEKILRE